MLNRSFQVINAVVPAKYLDDNTIYHLQPSGRFVIGGPQVIITHKLRILFFFLQQNLQNHHHNCSFPPPVLPNRVTLV